MIGYLHLTHDVTQETNHSAHSALETCLLTYVVEFPEIIKKEQEKKKISAQNHRDDLT